MYTWRLLGHDTSECPLRSGVGNELAPIMRTIEGELTRPFGFLGHVTEVVPRLSVLYLSAIHVPTGREWVGRRDSRGGVRWEMRYRPVDVGEDEGTGPSRVAGPVPRPAVQEGRGRAGR